jgi:hypothetical protein
MHDLMDEGMDEDEYVDGASEDEDDFTDGEGEGDDDGVLPWPEFMGGMPGRRGGGLGGLGLGGGGWEDMPDLVDDPGADWLLQAGEGIEC